MQIINLDCVRLVDNLRNILQGGPVGPEYYLYGRRRRDAGGGRDAWIAEYLAPLGQAVVDGADRYIRLVEEAGGRAEVTVAQGSILATFVIGGEQLYPLALTRGTKSSVQLCLGYLANRAAFAAVTVREALYDQLSAIAGPLSTRTLTGFPAFPVSRLNEPAVEEGVRNLLQHILSLRVGYAPID